MYFCMKLFLGMHVSCVFNNPLRCIFFYTLNEVYCGIRGGGGGVVWLGQRAGGGVGLVVQMVQ